MLMLGLCCYCSGRVDGGGGGLVVLLVLLVLLLSATR